MNVKAKTRDASYADSDLSKAVLRAISEGAFTLAAIRSRTRRFQDGEDQYGFERRVDRALQALRRAGKIRFIAKRWSAL